MKHQKLLSYIRRAVDDYNMIDENDRIAVGVSGGKDSLCLLLGLNSLKRFYPKPFEIYAVTVSLGFDGADFESVSKICESLGINYSCVKTDIGNIIFEDRKETNPCSLCSKMRKGVLNDTAKKLGCNKVALGHNRDDVIETFFMSLFYEGRINTFAPVSYLDRKDIYSIRPLIYAPENEISDYAALSVLETVKNPCPANGNTKRQEIKDLLAELSKTYGSLDEKVFGAIARSGIKGYRK
mgnify:CR=1 FL=1